MAHYLGLQGKWSRICFVLDKLGQLWAKLPFSASHSGQTEVRSGSGRPLGRSQRTATSLQQQFTLRNLTPLQGPLSAADMILAKAARGSGELQTVLFSANVRNVVVLNDHVVQPVGSIGKRLQ